MAVLLGWKCRGRWIFQACRIASAGEARRRRAGACRSGDQVVADGLEDQLEALHRERFCLGDCAEPFLDGREDRLHQAAPVVRVFVPYGIVLVPFQHPAAGRVPPDDVALLEPDHRPPAAVCYHDTVLLGQVGRVQYDVPGTVRRLAHHAAERRRVVRRPRRRLARGDPPVRRRQHVQLYEHAPGGLVSYRRLLLGGKLGA